MPAYTSAIAHTGRGNLAQAFVATLGSAVLRWQQRAAERRRLGTLDDRLLQDVALSRADLDGEVSKPFWRG